MLYEELDDRFGRRKKRTVIFGMAGGTPPTPPTPPTPSVLEEKDLNFYDFEGTLVASYDADEIAGLSELPEAPDHSADEVPLTFEEWNWTLAEIKEYHTDMPENKIDVGATYHTTDGKLHLIVETFEDNYLQPLRLSFQSDAEIDWGDGTSSSGQSDISHYYENKGRYHVVATTTSTYFDIYKSGPLKPKEAYLPQTITDLQGAFIEDHILEKIVIPSSVTALGSSAMKGCLLDTVILPRSLTEIIGSLLMQCYSLRVLSIPPTITTIGMYAITNCYRLKRVTMPKGLLSLDTDAFSSSEVAEIGLSPSLTSISISCFSSNRLLRKINVPASVREILSSAFSSCYALEQVELNEGLEKIGNGAFRSCRTLQTVTIPSTVTSIGNTAFNESYGLASVTVLATTPPTLGTNAFYSSTIQKIYVPAESVEAYKSATNWADYASKIEAIPA